MASAPITGTETTEDTGSSDPAPGDPLAEIKGAVTKNLTEESKVKVTVTGYVGDIRISLSDDITGHMEIPSSWGTVLLDLCGHTFTSNHQEGAVILTGDHIEDASVIISNEKKDDSAGESGEIIGYQGGPAISAASTSPSHLVIGSNVIIRGGTGDHSASGGDGGAAILKVPDISIYSGAKILGGNAAETGGDGGAAILLPNSYRIILESCLISGGIGFEEGSGGNGISGNPSGTAEFKIGMNETPDIKGGSGGTGGGGQPMDTVISIAMEFGMPVRVSQGQESISVVLENDTEDEAAAAVVIDPEWGWVKLDLNERTVYGSGGEEGFAILVGASKLDIVGPGYVMGCDGHSDYGGVSYGSSAILITDADGEVRISDGVQVLGGAGLDSSTGNGGAGGAGVATSSEVTGDSLPIVTVSGSSITGGAGGQSAPGSEFYGGAGGAAASGVNVTLSGGSSLTGGAGGAGGNGNTSEESTGGNGGNGGASISNGTVTVSDESSVVVGGNGGNGGYSSTGAGGNGGNGGDSPVGTGGVGGDGGYSPSGTGGNGGNGGASETGTGGAGGNGGNGSTEESKGSVGAGGSSLPSGSVSIYNITLTINGRGLDETNPIGNATVIVNVDDRTFFEGVTNANGQVIISGISSGTYSLVIEQYHTYTTVLEVGTLPEYEVVVNTQFSTSVSGNVDVVPYNLGDAVGSDTEAFEVNMNADVETNSTAKGHMDSYATEEYVTLIDYIDVTITSTLDEAGGSGTPINTPNQAIMFRLPVSEELIALLDDPVNSILVYRLHGTNLVTALDRVTESTIGSSSDCFYITSGYNGRTGALEYHAVIKSSQFSTFALGCQSSTPPEPEPTPTPTPTPTPPPTTFDAEAVDNLIHITVTNPQSGREYAVRDGSGGLQTTWSSGSGTIRFGPLQPGDTYSVVGRNSIVLNESTEATFVIPEVPEIVVVSVSSDSVTLASDDDVRYLLTDSGGNRVGTWVTGDGTDIVWEVLLPEEAYYAQAEVGQGRVILTAGPVLVRPPMGGEVTGDIRHEEAYIYVEPYEGWEYSLDGGPWQSSERIVYGPLAPGTVTLLARNTEAGLNVERVVDVPIVPTRASYTDRTVTITTEEGKTYMLADVDGGSVRGPGGDIWIAGTGGDVTWEGLDPRTDYFVYIVTGEGIDAIVFGPETVKLAEEVVTVSGANDWNDLYITLDNLAAGREYAIASSDGTVLTPWADGSEGTAGYGPIAFGASYTVLGRSVDGTGGTIVETIFEIPALPDYDSAEYSGEVLAMLTDPMWSYQLVDSSGGPVAVSGGIWIAGTGGDVVWEGLTGGMDHFMYARMNLAGFDVELGPVLVAEAVFATPGELDIPDSSQRSESVSVRSEEGVSYMLTDLEGNIVPGPGGQIWVRGTGDVMEWAVPDADDDYDITIRSADADTGAVTESGPHPVPRAEDPEEQPLYSLATVGLLAAYTLFLRLVHREGPFDRRTWAVTAAMLAATGLLYSGIWWQAGMTVTAAATFLSWLYCSDAVASKPKGGS